VRLASAAAPTVDGISANVLSLTEEVLTPMLSTKLLVAGVFLMLLASLIPGVWLYAQLRPPTDNGNIRAATKDEDPTVVPDKKAPLRSIRTRCRGTST
jgi:hypothetical protein